MSEVDITLGIDAELNYDFYSDCMKMNDSRLHQSDDNEKVMYLLAVVVFGL